MRSNERTRVLLVGEEVTLAHVGRVCALAESLDRSRFAVTVACGARYSHFVEATGQRVVSLRSLDSETFARSLAAGTPLFTSERLEHLIEDDLELLRAESPDVVVTDFRVSMGISAELAAIPHLALVNGYWSPYSTQAMPLPDLDLVQQLGLRRVEALARPFVPMVAHTHSLAFNRARRKWGLGPVDGLRGAYSHGTMSLYPDLPELAPTRGAPRTHRYLGPMVWQPPVEKPGWWSELPEERPIIYVTLGSSGSVRTLRMVAEALASERVTVVVSTAGQDVTLPPSFFVAPYVPGSELCGRASVVISNGGSGTTYQALEHGVPILGIPANADQYLAMGPVAAQRAGRLVASTELSVDGIRQEVARLLNDGVYRGHARRLGALVRAATPVKELERAILDVLPSRRTVGFSQVVA